MRPCRLFNPPFFDPRLLARKLAQVIDACPAHNTVLIHLDLGQIGIVEREDALNPDVARHLSDGEGLGGTRPGTLDHRSLKTLRTRLVPLTDQVFDRYGVSRLEFGVLHPLAVRVPYVIE